MRIFKNRAFTRWARASRITDKQIAEAVYEMARGLVDADLGGGVVKKRIAVAGRGKSGGVRSIVATNRGDLWIFLYGFKKNERANITSNELDALRRVATDLLSRSTSELDKLVALEALMEVENEGQT